MSMIEEEKDLEITDSIEHTCSEECLCTECQSSSRRYIQILDMERYVDQLNDWD